MNCIKCNRDVTPITDLTPSGIVMACPTCGNALERINNQNPMHPNASVTPSQAPEATVSPSRSLGSAGSAADITHRIESRLAEVRAEVLRLEGLKQEERSLKRLLRAAKPVTRAERTPIRIARNSHGVVVTLAKDAQ